MSFDFSCVDWSDEGSSPFDQSESCSSVCGDSVSETMSPAKSPKVRFAQEDEIFEIPHVKDFTEEDVHATWYRADEFLEMRNQIQRVVFLLEERHGLAGTVLESDNFTRRGLEFRTEQGGLERSEHRREAIAAVLEAQQKLWQQGRQDSEYIAAAYRDISKRILGMALLQGIQDQYDARDHVQSSIEPCVGSNTSSSPCKPYELDPRCKRFQVLEDIKILSVASEPELWHSSPAAA